MLNFFLLIMLFWLWVNPKSPILKCWVTDCGANGRWRLYEIGPIGRKEVHFLNVLNWIIVVHLIPVMSSRNPFSCLAQNSCLLCFVLSCFVIGMLFEIDLRNSRHFLDTFSHTAGLFYIEYVWNMVWELFSCDWIWTIMLLISASLVATVAVMSHLCLVRWFL
jgi:hypothetical protein